MTTEQKTPQVTSGGIGIFGLLGVAFVVLKLTGVIDWSWWWVTAPFWGGWGLLLAILVGGALVVGILVLAAAAGDHFEAKKKAKADG